MSSNKNHKNVHSCDKSNTYQNARRRELYRLMPHEEKEALLARRRAKRAELKRQRLFESSTNNAFNTASSSNSTNDFLEQNLISMRDSMLLTKSSYSSHMPLETNYVKLKDVSKCQFCKSKKFEFEPPAFCCGNGSIQLTTHEIPTELKNLYLSNNDESKHFRTHIRTYNNIFAFTSLGVTYDKDLAKRKKGIYTFRVQGQMYHFINDLIPTNQKGKNLQLYFYDSENEVRNRMACSNKLNENIVKKLMDVLKINPYTMFLKSLINVPQLSDFYIALKSDPGLDQRVYNLPTVSEVAGIWVEQDINNSIPTPHIRIYTKSDKSQLVNYYYGCYDPLQYPLLFPYGQAGWHCGIKKIKHSSNTSQICCEQEQLPSVINMSSIDGLLNMEAEMMQKGKRKKDIVTCREYYCYKLQIRDDENIILHAGRLFQQYIVDEWIKIETQRLDFASFNQDLFRVDVLDGILDILRNGERDASHIGKQRILPLSFTGGPKDMRRRYMDAIALVQHFGKPDIFLTMTCNPSWPEIEENLLPTDEVQNRPDLVSRVFKAKLEELKDDILKRRVFGKVAAFMYTIEFQKRGLPHTHLLIILDENYKLLTPEAYDQYVCAELPDEKINPYLYSLVTQHMMHGPCGSLNPTNSCMKKKGFCKNKYPKEFVEHTTKGKNSYPIYRRRNTGKSVKIRGHYLDNSWVVPYNPLLLCKYNCHMNVEICSDIKVVKYIYKYICKGHDKIAFQIHTNDANMEIDEIKEYQSARWVSPPEAAWRIFAFPISEMSPSVYHLQLHLDGQQFVCFKSTDNISRIVNNPMIKKTMLTEFFLMNKVNKEAMDLNLLYREFPEHFVWSSSQKMWTRRKRGHTIGRVVTCHPTEGERYYLRLLLMNVRGPKSYEDLMTVNGIHYNTFREAAEKRGLLLCDNNLIECMSEAVSFQMPSSLRQLFAMLLIYCNPTNPRDLWERFESPMSEDFKRSSNNDAREIRYKVLRHIDDILHTMGSNINEFKLISEKIKPSSIAREAKDVHYERNIIVSEEDLFLQNKLNTEQKKAYNMIIDRVFSNKSGAFFIDGPGGTGKSFLYRALLATVRHKGFIALATASSGVAASLLPGGRTAHSRFKIPIDVNENFNCNISKQSPLACLIRDARLIVWDEISMAKKKWLKHLISF